jgi:hypothetical protein
MTAPTTIDGAMMNLIWKFRCALALIIRTDISPHVAWDFAGSLHANWGDQFGPVETAEMDMEYWHD